MVQLDCRESAEDSQQFSNSADEIAAPTLLLSSKTENIRSVAAVGGVSISNAAEIAAPTLLHSSEMENIRSVAAVGGVSIVKLDLHLII
eukprot:scaffold2077_cov66-Cyclotella_meneghiniana.AAC.2